jgi:hexosaminidase
MDWKLLRSTSCTSALFCAMLAAACNPAAAPPPAPQTTPAGPRIIPQPASLVLSAGTGFEVTPQTRITVVNQPEVVAIADYLAAFLRRATQFPLPVNSPSAGGSTGVIELRLDGSASSLGDEGYRLTVNRDSVRLVAHTPIGLFRGTQTIRQLLPTDIESEIGVTRAVWPIPALEIADQPRFAWRGAMLDVARHFFTVNEVEDYIDLLTLYKINVFHLHLTDDQGWRIQINSRPKLTTMGAVTQVGGGRGGFYTQQEYQEIVRYAAARYITVVPEIEMPSHINAALVAYPELSCSERPPAPYTGIEVGWSTICVNKEESYAFIDDVVRELSAITPGAFIHIGGDEVKTLTDEQYIRFVERVQDIVVRHGKRMIGWEEVAKVRLKPSSLVQPWKGDSASSALQYGAKLIMSPARKAYLDMKYTQSTELGLNWAALIEVSDAYDWDPAHYNPGVGEKDVLGVEAPVWSETPRNISAVEFLAMPRLPAIAEVGWTPQASREWQNFRVRLAAHAPRWRYLGVNYYHSPQIPW